MQKQVKDKFKSIIHDLCKKNIIQLLGLLSVSIAQIADQSQIMNHMEPPPLFFKAICIM